MAPPEHWFEVELTVAGEVVELFDFQMDEAVFGVGRLVATLIDREAPLPAGEELVGKDARFVVRSHAGHERRFAGFVASAVHRQLFEERVVVLTVLPVLARLELRRDCRIFQKLTPDAIVKKVLSGAGVPESAQKWSLKEPHPEREYTVQYRETDLAFVSRLLAEEGIYFVPHFGEDGLELVLSDDPRGVGDIAGDPVLPFLQELGFELREECAYHVAHRHALVPDKVFVRDRDFEKPQVMLEHAEESTDPGAHSFEYYEYPGRFTLPAEAARHAQQLLLSLQAERMTVSGETLSIRLVPGLRAKLDEHPWTALNQEYLLLRTSLAGAEIRRSSDATTQLFEARSLRASFEGVPTARTRYKPPRTDVALAVPGLQTAITTGPSGEEIHVDKHGRVSVHFHWDRLGKSDETSSLWIRTSQVPLGGAMLLPRMGWEVTVAFSEGDVDRPYVMGRFYNAMTPPPYALPATKASMAVQTATTPGGGSSNEFSMSDTKGSEGMLFNGSRDMSVGVGNNATESVKNNQAVTVGSNHTLDIAGALTSSVGADESVSVSGNQQNSIGTLLNDDSGTHSLTIGGNRKLSIGGDHRRDVSGASTLTVGGNSIDLVAGAIFESTLAAMTHNVGAALVELAGGSRSVVVGGVRSESTGALKAVVTKGGRGLEAAAYSNQVGGAFVALVKGDRKDEAKAMYTDLAAGLQITKANNVLFEAQATIVVQMGAASLMITPASISITGAAIKIDGATVDTGGMVIDN